jgi:hypothetical protein
MVQNLIRIASNSLPDQIDRRKDALLRHNSWIKFQLCLKAGPRGRYKFIRIRPAGWDSRSIYAEHAEVAIKKFRGFQTAGLEGVSAFWALLGYTCFHGSNWLLLAVNRVQETHRQREILTIFVLPVDVNSRYLITFGRGVRQSRSFSSIFLRDSEFPSRNQEWWGFFSFAEKSSSPVIDCSPIHPGCLIGVTTAPLAKSM